MLTRWDPLREMNSLQRRVNQLFDEFFSGRRGRREASETLWAPAVNTYEDSDAYLLSCDIPGVAEEDVKMNLDADTLTISGTRKLEHKDDGEHYQRTESPYGDFSRSFTLPAAVDPDKVEAQMEKGVLEIRLPKREQSKPKQIAIRAK